MRYTQALIDLSSSTLAFSDKRDQTDHFKWDSIKKFLYLAFTFSSSSTNFDIVSSTYENVRIIDFIICEMTVGMSYMCMDFFIKQYTRKICFNATLSPLLKGIGYGILLQTALWTLLHATDLADSLRFLTATFQSTPSWSSCIDIGQLRKCVPSKDVIVRCREKNFTDMLDTSAHVNYLIAAILEFTGGYDSTSGRVPSLCQLFNHQAVMFRIAVFRFEGQGMPVKLTWHVRLMSLYGEHKSNTMWANIFDNITYIALIPKNNCYTSVPLARELLQNETHLIATLRKYREHPKVVISTKLKKARQEWKSFLDDDKNIVTTKFFTSALVWIFNFFCSSVADETLIKVFKITCIWRFTSTLGIIILLLVSYSENMAKAISKMMDLSAPSSYMNSMDHVTYAYGIGFVGVYDFGTMNAHTMVDNAVIIFTLAFTLNAFARSLIVRILYDIMSSCVKVEYYIRPHYLLFSILPLATDFLYAHKMYIIYIYLNLLLATVSYLAMLTLSMAKLLHSEYRSVKNIYIVGLICFLGFCCSTPITLSVLPANGLIYGLNVTVLYLGGFKVAIVMWIYGVEKFSTDIKFWLGFKPTKYWTLCWTFMPFVLIFAGVSRVYTLTKMEMNRKYITAVVWLSLSFATVFIIQAKTVASFILRSNLAKIFRSSAKYGPPDPEDRKRRRLYNETIRLRYCVHNCIVLDETYDCNHLPLANQSRSASTLSVTLSEQPSSHTQNIYTAGVVYRRRSSTDGIPYD